jgi:hypothetical protein
MPNNPMAMSANVPGSGVGLDGLNWLLLISPSIELAVNPAGRLNTGPDVGKLNVSKNCENPSTWTEPRFDDALRSPGLPTFVSMSSISMRGTLVGAPKKFIVKGLLIAPEVAPANTPDEVRVVDTLPPGWTADVCCTSPKKSPYGTPGRREGQCRRMNRQCKTSKKRRRNGVRPGPGAAVRNR